MIKVITIAVIASLAAPVMAGTNDYVEQTNIDSGDGNTWVTGLRVRIDNKVQYVRAGELGLTRSIAHDAEKRVAWAEAQFGTDFKDRVEGSGLLYLPGPDGELNTADDVTER